MSPTAPEPESSATPAARAGLTLALGGMTWFAAGAAVIIATQLLRGWGPGPLSRYGPFIPMVAGAYAVVLGLEKMVSGLRQARGRAARAGVACALLVAAAGAGSAWAYVHRAPYWDAIRNRAGGELATEKLRALTERHVAVLQSGAGSAAALESWKRTAEGALALGPDFAAALQGARFLETAAGGQLRSQSEIDARFYALCLEWMDLYRDVRQSFDDVSMSEPPEEWSRQQDDIIDRIQALPRHPPEGS